MARALVLAAVFIPVCARAQPVKQTCVDVQVGSAQSYDCLNQQLGAIAHEAPRSSADLSVPYNANSPGNVTGQFNEAATRNRLGSNFGRSVVPARPAANPPAAFGAPR